MTTKYTFESTSTYEFHDNSSKTHRRHRRNTSSSSDQHNDNASLTYSATSSINSGTGESTDSSFADIMKVLEFQDGKEIVSYLKGSRKDEKSVTESLAYSTDADTYLRSLAATDAESHLHGTDLLSISRSLAATEAESHLHGTDLLSISQPNVNDKSQGERDDFADAFADNILFAPAEHTESIKQRKERKRQERLQRRAAAAKAANDAGKGGSSRSLNSSSGGRSGSNHRSHAKIVVSSTSSSSRGSNALAAPDSPQFESRQGTPPSSNAPSPRPPKSKSRGAHHGPFGDYKECSDDDEDVWYAKWWMFCFPDAVKNMTERR